MVLNDEAKSVELTYAGETVDVTETAIELYNERQSAMLSLEKLLEKDSAFGIGKTKKFYRCSSDCMRQRKCPRRDGSSCPGQTVCLKPQAVMKTAS